MAVVKGNSSDSSRPSAESDQDGQDSQTRTWWKFRMRPYNDEDEEDWWFASTGIPLIAATTGPLANVTSIAALVTSWRMSLDAGDGTLLPELSGVPIKDPYWVYWPNVASLICGFLGNIFLMLNFTNRIRYIFALPSTILLWYVSSGILMAITISNNIYLPPQRPMETYTQGFWYAVISAVLYTFSSMVLMVNMLGYFLGHYPQRFTLTDHQRNLILQTILFFAWLAGGGAMFSAVENTYGTTRWSFVDGVYFCDVTILTVGFGDLYPTDDVGRGLVFPFSVGGIIMLGLMVSSIHNFAKELSHDNIIKRHAEKKRIHMVGRAVSDSMELRRAIEEKERPPQLKRATTFGRALRRTTTLFSFTAGPVSLRVRKPKILILREEKDRFVAMRNIQRSTSRFKRWYALTLSVLAFSLLWCVGALVFWVTERHTLQLNYFQALYFGYVSLLTIGYGDLAPKSNAGRAFFVVWSLIAVPTMTILVSDMGDTIISNFKRGTFIFADFTLLPKTGIWHNFLQRHPWLLGKIERRWGKRKEQQSVNAGDAEKQTDSSNDLPAAGIPMTDAAPEDVEAAKEDAEAMQEPPPTLDQLAKEMTEQDEEVSEHDLARKLALMIRKTAHDLQNDRTKKYSFEEWVEITRLIRFTSSKKRRKKRTRDEDDSGDGGHDGGGGGTAGAGGERRGSSAGTADGSGRGSRTAQVEVQRDGWGRRRRKSSVAVGINQALFEPTAAERRKSSAGLAFSQPFYEPTATERRQSRSRSTPDTNANAKRNQSIPPDADADDDDEPSNSKRSQDNKDDDARPDKDEVDPQDDDQDNEQNQDTDEELLDDEEEEDEEYEDEGLIEWDWIGPDSPMMGEQSEPEFVLDRLCESMGRYIRRQITAGSRRASVVKR